MELVARLVVLKVFVAVRGTCKMLALAGQSNGTNVGGRMRYARRGTMRPLARTNNV